MSRPESTELKQVVASLRRLTELDWNTPVYTAFEFVMSQRTAKSQFVAGLA
jgi:hypothetical protein